MASMPLNIRPCTQNPLAWRDEAVSALPR